MQSIKNNKILQASYRVFVLVACKNWSNAGGWCPASLQTNLYFQPLLVQCLHYRGTAKTEDRLFLVMALVKPTFIPVLTTNVPQTLWLQQAHGGRQRRSQGGSWLDPNPSWWPPVGDLVAGGQGCMEQGRLQGETPHCQVGAGLAREVPFRHLQGAHKHPYNFPRNNKSVMSSTTFFSRHLRVLVEKLCFSQKCHFFGNKEVSFQPKIVALGRKCSHASNPSIPT